MEPYPAKSKCKMIYVCSRAVGLDKPAPLLLCGQPLPWFSTATHLGHELHKMRNNAIVKRAILVEKSVEV